jgi:Lon-like ATP-dependent protease
MLERVSIQYLPSRKTHTHADLLSYSCTKEVVSSVQELHNVGTFCNIVELQDLGDKLRMIVMAHRRIRLIGQVVLEEEVQINPVSPGTAEDSGKKRRFRRRPKDASKGSENESSGVSSGDEASASEAESSARESPSAPEEPIPIFTPIPVLMIEAENVKPAKPVMTTEVKVSLKTKTL